MGWVFVGLTISIVASLIGGIVCHLIAKSMKVNYWLAGIVFVLGVLSAFAEIGKPAPGERGETVDMTTAMTSARMPTWYAFALPIIGAAGAVAGGMIREKKTGA